MTREEAIDLLDNLIGFIEDNHDSDYDKALKMAIEALKQEPKYCDRNICIKNEYNGIGCDECEVTKSQEPKIGHWKRISIDKYVQHAMAYYKCSECGKDIIGEHNYCPNCGAKMESEDKE